MPRISAARGLFPLRPAKHETDVLLFQLLQREGVLREHLKVALALADERREVPGADKLRVLQDQDALDGVLQLPDVSGPGVLLEDLHGIGRDPGDVPVDAFAEAVEEVLDQERDVPLAASKGREADGDHAQAIVEVLPEGAGRDGLVEVPVEAERIRMSRVIFR